MVEGCCLPRTNLTETDPAVLRKRYIQATEAEWVFRINNDRLQPRPVWHPKQERVQAHILVCFPADALRKTLAPWARVSGPGNAPRTLLEGFAKIKRREVVLKEPPKRLSKCSHDIGLQSALALPPRLIRAQECLSCVRCDRTQPS